MLLLLFSCLLLPSISILDEQERRAEWQATQPPKLASSGPSHAKRQQTQHKHTTINKTQVFHVMFRLVEKRHPPVHMFSFGSPVAQSCHKVEASGLLTGASGPFGGPLCCSEGPLHHGLSIKKPSPSTTWVPPLFGGLPCPW